MMTETLWSLVQLCWEVIPVKRPTIKVIISFLRESSTRGVGSPPTSCHINPTTLPKVTPPSNSVPMKGTTWRHPLLTYLTIRRLDPSRNRELTSSPLSMTNTPLPELSIGDSSDFTAVMTDYDIHVSEEDIVIGLAPYLCGVVGTNTTSPQVNGSKWVRKELSGYFEHAD